MKRKDYEAFVLGARDRLRASMDALKASPSYRESVKRAIERSKKSKQTVVGPKTDEQNGGK